MVCFIVDDKISVCLHCVYNSKGEFIQTILQGFCAYLLYPKIRNAKDKTKQTQKMKQLSFNLTDINYCQLFPFLVLKSNWQPTEKRTVYDC